MGRTQRGPTDQKALPPEQIGDSQHTTPPLPPTPPYHSSHIIQTLSNAKSLVGYFPADHDNKERRINNAQAASAAVGGASHVLNITVRAAVGHVKLSHRGWRVNVKL